MPRRAVAWMWRRRVEQGEAFDVVVLASNAIDKLIAGRQGAAWPRRSGGVRRGHCRACGRATPLGGHRGGCAARGASAASLSYSTGPSGVYLEKLFQRWGILEKCGRASWCRRRAFRWVRWWPQGKAELGFQQLVRADEPAGHRCARAAAALHPDADDFFRWRVCRLRGAGSLARLAGFPGIAGNGAAQALSTAWRRRAEPRRAAMAHRPARISSCRPPRSLRPATAR